MNLCHHWLEDVDHIHEWLLLAGQHMPGAGWVPLLL